MPTISVIGLGICQPPLLTTAAQAVLSQAQVVFGSPRQLASIAQLLPATCEQRQLPKLSQLKDQLGSLPEVAILASGDPLLFGIGNSFPSKLPVIAASLVYRAPAH